MSAMPATRRALLAVAALALLAAAGCTQGSQPRPHANSGSGQPSSGTAVGGGTSGVRWHACAGSNASLRCGSLKVPLDYAKPSGRTITLALSEVLATAPPAKRQGILLVNPGGPGGSGLGLASFLPQGPTSALVAKYLPLRLHPP